MHRNSRLKKSNKMQQYADIYLLLNYSTCLGRPSRPSSGVHKTVVASSGTDHTIWGASFLKGDQIRPERDHRSHTSPWLVTLHFAGFLQPNMELVCFQRDSALAYFTLNVCEFMNEAFPDRWVFRGSADPLQQCHGLHAIPMWPQLIAACGE